MKHPRHLAWIRTLPCIVCGDPTATEAAHIRYSEPRCAKPNPGMGAKPDDAFVVPLCGEHHRLQHKGSEKTFWAIRGIDPCYVALALWKHSGDVNAAGMIHAAHANRLEIASR